MNEDIFGVIFFLLCVGITLLMIRILEIIRLKKEFNNQKIKNKVQDIQKAIAEYKRGGIE